MADVRTRLLQAAEELLTTSPDRDITTRDVCAAAGVGAPVLYRQFGDKTGLLRALVDYGFDRYLRTKRSATPSDNPADDLRQGWDTHIAFAKENPAVYRLMFSPFFQQVPDTAGEAMTILRRVLERCAAAGQLILDVDAAAQAIMAANTGVALSLITQPARYSEPDLSTRVRDAVHRTLLTPEALATTPASSTPADVPNVARQLAAMMAAEPGGLLTPAETALLNQWLGQLAKTTRS